jgi:crotonobetainyl-CoA:carnitine CoA-transferase CaiB-like acyl-CoA transferase
VTLNLSDENDYKIFLGLVKDCDVVVENYSPNIKFKLKIDYETLKELNPKLIYASISGY